MKAARESAVEVLRRHVFWQRVAWPLGILVFGLALTLAVGWWLHPSWARVDKVGSLAWWAGAVVLTGMAALLALLLRSRSLLRSARRLDDRFSARNRLETAAALQGSESPLAKAQREETSAFLETVPAGSHLLPLCTLCVLVIFLILAHLFTLTAWIRPWARFAKAVPEAKAAVSVSEASIKWKSPEAETKAAPIEEVPLEATAYSTTGLRDAVLEMAVNGETKLNVPLNLAELQSAGKHPVKTSIYLDQLEVHPFDVVSYFVRAQRISPEKLPPTVSPVQFVQIKPFRDDVREMPGGDGFSRFNLITALKAAQLRLTKENFLLAHTDLSHESPAWRKENERVGSEQATLAKKTQEVIDLLIADGAPAEVINLLSQSKPLMADAAQKIQSSGNKPALAPQGKALARITEIEKLIVKLAARDGSSRGPRSVSDPFGDQKNLELKQRFKTQAGELELLAREQKRLAEDLANPEAVPAPASDPNAQPDPSKIEGTLSERQTQISQRAGALTNGQIFIKEVLDHLEKGRDFAKESLRHLDASNPLAAQEPAASAARELAQAVEIMNRAAEDEARDKLAQALRDLNRAAEEARKTAGEQSDDNARRHAEEAANRARQTAQDLAKAAQAQQETGSQNAARRLNELAKALSRDDLRKALDKLLEQPRDAAAAEAAAAQLQHLADEAGRQRNPNGLSADQIAQLVQRIERARTNMQKLAEKEGSGKTPGERTEKNSPSNQGNSGSNPTPSQGQGQAQGQSQNLDLLGRTAQNAARTSEEHSLSRDAGRETKLVNGHGSSEPRNTSREGDNSELTSDLSYQTPPKGGPPDSVIGRAHASTLLPKPAEAETRERFARQLVGDLREALHDAVAVSPNSPELSALQEALRGFPDTAAHIPDFAAFFVQINPPLEGLIDMLRLQAGKIRRQHDLTDQEMELAPPAYRTAVSDYFEQLSRDYEKPAETPQETEQ